MGWEKILSFVADLIALGFSLAAQAGQTDAFVLALDSTLAAARAKTDADIRAKPRKRGSRIVPGSGPA